MIDAVDHFEIEILDKPFELNTDRTLNKTAVVKFIRNRLEIKRVEYGILPKEEIYEVISKNEEINLNNCYINDFSLNEYRSTYNIKENDYVDLNSFSAIKSFFDCEGSTDFSFAHFKSDANFQNTIFNHGITSFQRARFDCGDTDFEQALFKVDEISFLFAEFSGGDALFQSAKFDCYYTSFINTNFADGKVNFRDANFFKSKVDFHYSKFAEGDITFYKAVFGGDTIDFRRVEFGSGKVDFRKVIFGNATVTFEESEFTTGKISFKGAEFGSGNVSFDMVNFGDSPVSFEDIIFGSGEVSFADTRFTTLSFKETHFNGYVDLRVKEGEMIDLSDTVVRDIIDLIPVDKHPVKIKTLYLTYLRNMGRIFIDWEKNKVKSLIYSQEETNDIEKASQFNLLKGNFVGNGQYEDEDLAYIEFKRSELRHRLKEAKKEGGPQLFKERIIYGFQKLVFDMVGLYATNPTRVLVSMFVVFSIYGILYTLLPLLPFITDAHVICPGGEQTFLETLGNNFYFSAITFLTIGYGDCLPSGLFKYMAPLEGWMGVFLMSYFTVAFVRNILR